MQKLSQRTVTFWLGATGIVFTTVVWLFTGRIEPYLVGAFLALMGIGEGHDALKEFQKDRKNGD